MSSRRRREARRIFDDAIAAAASFLGRGPIPESVRMEVEKAQRDLVKAINAEAGIIKRPAATRPRKRPPRPAPAPPPILVLVVNEDD